MNFPLLPTSFWLDTRREQDTVYSSLCICAWRIPPTAGMCFQRPCCCRVSIYQNIMSSVHSSHFRQFLLSAMLLWTVLLDGCSSLGWCSSTAPKMEWFHGAIVGSDGKETALHSKFVHLSFFDITLEPFIFNFDFDCHALFYIIWSETLFSRPVYAAPCLHWPLHSAFFQPKNMAHCILGPMGFWQAGSSLAKSTTQWSHFILFHIYIAPLV